MEAPGSCHLHSLNYVLQPGAMKTKQNKKSCLEYQFLNPVFSQHVSCCHRSCIHFFFGVMTIPVAMPLEPKVAEPQIFIIFFIVLQKCNSISLSTSLPSFSSAHVCDFWKIWRWRNTIPKGRLEKGQCMPEWFDMIPEYPDSGILRWYRMYFKET